jgi:4'-phosphopantetheinyl transferase EntD/3-hydroxymyristoyl/3-hydroxydecanoyl-(acyl carrier protein) dehydratase
VDIRVRCLRPEPGLVLTMAAPVTGTTLPPHVRPPWVPEEVTPSRQSDFVLSRTAVMAAQAIFEVGGLVVADGRRPVFPPGLRGSISHSQGRIGVCLGTDRPEVVAVGVDIERHVRLSIEGLRYVATPAERDWVLADKCPGRTLTGLFAAKEAIYKSVSALASRPPGFLDVELRPAGDGRFRVNCPADLLPAGLTLDATVTCVGDYVVAHAVVRTDRAELMPHRYPPPAKPAGISVSSTGDAFRARRAVLADDRYLGGRYPGRRIYPGAFVLDSVLRSAEVHLGKPLRIEDIPAIALTGILGPGDTLHLDAECADLPDSFQVRAACTDHNGTAVATLTVHFKPSGPAEPGA